MKKILWIGIDPGMHGAVGAIYPGGKAMAWETPELVTRKLRSGLTKSGKKRYTTKYDFDEPGMADVLRPFLVWRKKGYEIRVAIERVQAMPDEFREVRQGSTSIFRFGTAYGVWLGIIGAFGLKPVTKKIAPGEWKPWTVGVGAEKEVSRQVCQEIYPDLCLAMKKDADRAEAILIADYNRRQTLKLPFLRTYVRPKKKDSTRPSRKSVAAVALAQPQRKPVTKHEQPKAKKLPQTTQVRRAG